MSCSWYIYHIQMQKGKKEVRSFATNEFLAPVCLRYGEDICLQLVKKYQYNNTFNFGYLIAVVYMLLLQLVLLTSTLHWQRLEVLFIYVHVRMCTCRI